MHTKTTLRTLVSSIAILSVAVLFQACSKGPSEEDLKRISDLESALADQEALTAKESKKAAAIAEAKRLAEEAAGKSVVAEAARLASLANQVEMDRAEKARLEGLVNELNSKSDAISQQQLELQDALAKARVAREQAAIDATKKVQAVEMRLANLEASQQTEIQAARKAARESALAEALARTEERAKEGGYTPATDVITSREPESISAFLTVEISERNFRNNTRRTAQRREGE